ncbi:hypothetical protein BV898_06586 [Hypsibius exemplaris]|uniref:Uncharacterized protein n=1 Tax=Hypsibius exemplaris TaxID=2072580 RepID=A0A1W0WVX1_HYPEX|nr:hypothetical protein BV898_06586 [Hypsibius exemplaris]
MNLTCTVTFGGDRLDSAAEVAPPVENLVERRRRAHSMSRNHDSARSTSYAKQDSGFITNSSLSRDASPTRESLSLMRKSQGISPSIGKYVFDRYKSPVIETMRNHALISTFEDMEIEKLMLKDENSDMKDKMYQFQASLRQIEASRIRDAERFDLQEREVNALRIQLKAEKDSRQTVMSLAEELQSDLTRKSDLLSIANEELIETRDRLRNLDKQLHEEGNNRSHVERTAREVREKMDDMTAELEMERKQRKVTLENIRELKEQITQMEMESNMFMEAIKDLSRIFESSSSSTGAPTSTGTPTIRLHNQEAEEKLLRIVRSREQLLEKVASLQKDLTAKTTHSTGITDDIVDIARILRREVKDDVVANSLLDDVALREQRTAISSIRTSPAMEPLQTALSLFIEQEIKKRKVLKLAIEDRLAKFSWKGTSLNETQVVPLLDAVLSSWSVLRDHQWQLRTRLNATRKQVAGIAKTMADSTAATRTTLVSYKNGVLIPSRHRLAEDFYRFVEGVKSRNETTRRSLEATMAIRMANETGKVRTEQEARMMEAVDRERDRIRQLEAEMTSLNTNLKAKDEYSLKLIREVRDAESKLYHLMEENKRLQTDHSVAIATVGQQHSETVQSHQLKMKELQTALESEVEKLKQQLEHRAKTIAVLDETILTKDQRVSKLQAKLKEQVKKEEALLKELAAEKDPSKTFKLTAAIKTFEREITELRAKVVERDTLVTHLKRRVDEALNRGVKKTNEVTERSRAELAVKEAKFVEKEKEVEKLQEQLTRLSRVVSKSTVPAKMISAGADSSRSTIFSAAPTVRSVVNTRSVSGSDTTRAPDASNNNKLPPLVPAAGLVGADPSSNVDKTSDSPVRSTFRSTYREPAQKVAHGVNRSLERLAYQPTESLMAAQAERRRNKSQEPVLPPWRPPSAR